QFANHQYPKQESGEMISKSLLAASGRAVSLAVALSVLSLAGFLAGCQSKRLDPVGTWRGLIKNNSGEQVAFTLEVKRDGDKLIGALVNGDDRTVSTDGSFEGNRLKLRYDFYDAALNATIDGDKLDGAFTRQWRKQTLRRELHAARGN